jgi:D-aspartate ligase
MGDQRARPAGVDTTTPAVVLKLDPNVMHHGGLGVIRSLGRIGVPVYGVHEGPMAPAAHSRYLQGRAYWQPGADDAGRITDGLAALADRIGERAVLLPTDDAGAIFLAEHGTRLRPRFIFPDPPRDLPRQVAGKFSLHELAQATGIPSPAAAVPLTAAAAREFAERAGYPLIAKLTTPWASSLRSTTIITTPAGLDDAMAACAREGAGLMLQEFIPGGRDTDWFFHGYCDATSACAPAFTGVKERSYPAHAGLTSLGRSEPNAELRDQVTQMLTKLGYQGLLDLDLRLDRRDGRYKLLDFNPRLGAQFRLFATTGGLDLATAAYLDLTGQPVGDTTQAAGRRFLVENYDPLAALGYWRRGELSPRTWLASLRGTSEAAWFARDDLAPFGLMCLRMGWRLACGGRGRPAPAPGFRFSPGRGARARAAPANPPETTRKAPLIKEARA